MGLYPNTESFIFINVSKGVSILTKSPLPTLMKVLERKHIGSRGPPLRLGESGVFQDGR
jgi:hypothetical protein